MKLAFADLTKKIQIKHDGIGFGSESSLKKFGSDLLEFSVAAHGQSTAIWIGEGADPFPDAIGLSSASYQQFTAFAGVKLFFDVDDPDGGITLARTSTGACPIYVSATSDKLSVSWRFEDAALTISDRLPDIEACRIYLRHGTRPVRNQVIRGVRAVWPGETLRATPAGLEIANAYQLPIALEGPVRDAAQVAERFLELTGAAMEPVLSKSRRPLVEVSGGYDSTCAVLAASRRRGGLSSYAVIHEGPSGMQQIRRRKELVDLLGLQDHTGPSYTPGPFESLSVDECTRTVFDDVYRLPCMAAVDGHPQGPFDLVVTGIGGDELCLDENYHREVWEVPGTLPSSSLDAAAARCDMFMRRGIWVCHPFINSQVVNFCRALPAGFRANRTLNVLAQVRAGLSDGYVFPRFAENYAESGRREAYLQDFDELLGDSMVGDYGIIDVNGLLVEARKATRHGIPPELSLKLWFVLKLETILRRYIA